MIEYYCPKCNGTNVEVRHKKREVIRKPMDQMPGPVGQQYTAQSAVLILPPMEAHCKDCDHTLPLVSNAFPAVGHATCRI